jgi:hypothetical protein
MVVGVARGYINWMLLVESHVLKSSTVSTPIALPMMKFQYLLETNIPS